MNKRGIGIITLIIVGLIIGVIMTFVIIYFFEGKSFFEKDDQPKELIPETTANEEEVIEEENQTNIQEVNETDNNETQEQFIDLEATSMILESDGCELDENDNVTRECSMLINVTITNIGTITISDRFISQILDISSSVELIEILSVDSLGPGENKEFIDTYKNITPNDYFIKLRVDSSYQIDEDNEFNNELIKSVEIP